VGLSIGGTPLLDSVGKIVIIGCMYVGRVGPLTLLLSFRGGSRGDPWGLPEQEVTVG
jgi:trk system potassium uptake protein TrkH